MKAKLNWRNPYAETLRQYAEKKGSEFAGACGVPGVTAVLGGALAYDAALRGNYDIDMRLLVPGTWSSPETQQQIDKVMEWLVSRAKEDDAFDIAGTTPRTIRALSPEIKDIGIILTYDHLVRLVQKETAFLFTRDKSKRESAHKLSLMMAKMRQPMKTP